MPRRPAWISYAALTALLTVTSVITAGPVGASGGRADASLQRAGEAAGSEAGVPFPLRPDFNGDRYSDLAVGVRGEGISAERQGAVNVIYGSSDGLTPTENELWSQDVPGVVGTGEFNDAFGDAVGWADFNGDDFDDLAVGVPGDLVSGKDDAGAVNVIYGSASGLTTAGNQLWTQATAGIPGEPRTGDYFGNALLGRDFNNDGFGDLVIGAFGDGGDGFPRDTGTAQVLYGSAAGLTATGNQWLHQLKGKPQRFDWFAHTLGSGFFNDDQYADLAIGVPYETLGGIDTVGAVNIMYGSATGLTTAGNQLWHQATPGVVGEPASQEHLGWSLSVADFDGDGHGDLAVGIAQDDVGAAGGAGSVLALYGSVNGLTASGSELWNQDSAGIADTAEVSDTNSDVVTADFDGDGFADLAMGFQHEDMLGAQDAGAVNVIYGTAAGLSSAGSQIWYQDGGLEEVGELTDWFGAALSRADFDGDGYLDLVIGVPGESVAAGVFGGAIQVVYGSAGGLTSAGNQLWHQNSPGILDASENPDFFGENLMER